MPSGRPSITVCVAKVTQTLQRVAAHKLCAQPYNRFALYVPGQLDDEKSEKFATFARFSDIGECLGVRFRSIDRDDVAVEVDGVGADERGRGKKEQMTRSIDARAGLNDCFTGRGKPNPASNAAGDPPILLS
jgi:hypothetical protein